MFVTPTIIILQQFVIVMTSATAIIMGISTVPMIIPQAAYATETKEIHLRQKMKIVHLMNSLQV